MRTCLSFNLWNGIENYLLIRSLLFIPILYFHFMYIYIPILLWIIISILTAGFHYIFAFLLIHFHLCLFRSFKHHKLAALSFFIRFIPVKIFLIFKTILILFYSFSSCLIFSLMSIIKKRYSNSKPFPISTPFYSFYSCSYGSLFSPFHSYFKFIFCLFSVWFTL